MKKTLTTTALFFCCLSTLAHASLPAAVSQDKRPVGRFVFFDSSTKTACYLDSQTAPTFSAAIADQTGKAAETAAQIFALNKPMHKCSGSSLAQAQALIQAGEGRTQTAFAALAWAGIAAYYVACSIVDVKATGDSVSQVMILGGGPTTVAEYAAATVCFPVSVVNMAILWVGFQAADEYDRLTQKKSQQNVPSSACSINPNAC